MPTWGHRQEEWSVLSLFESRSTVLKPDQGFGCVQSPGQEWDDDGSPIPGDLSGEQGGLQLVSVAPTVGLVSFRFASGSPGEQRKQPPFNCF